MTKPPSRAKVKLKTGRGRKLSSQRWLTRQLNDPYVRKAQAEGYRSRATYKLTEILERYPLVKPGHRVVDLGAAPGGWAQVLAKYVKPQAKKGAVIGVDLLEIAPLPDITFIQGDFTDDKILTELEETLDGKPLDGVFSDMSPATSGHQGTDHLRIVQLVDEALYFALQHLRPGGLFVAKVFQGGAQGDLLNQVKQNFTKIVHMKPKASRKDSPEMYLIAIGYKPPAHTKGPQLVES